MQVVRDPNWYQRVAAIKPPYLFFRQFSDKTYHLATMEENTAEYLVQYIEAGQAQTVHIQLMGQQADWMEHSQHLARNCSSVHQAAAFTHTSIHS